MLGHLADRTETGRDIPLGGLEEALEGIISQPRDDVLTQLADGQDHVSA
jgi:hypothetical protein